MFYNGWNGGINFYRDTVPNWIINNTIYFVAGNNVYETGITGQFETVINAINNTIIGLPGYNSAWPSGNFKGIVDYCDNAVSRNHLNDVITGNYINLSASTDMGIYFNGAGGTVGFLNVNIANNTLIVPNGYAIYADAVVNSTFRNNTLAGGSPDEAYLTAPSSGNTFYWNNFTATSGYYVQDLNGGNYYNTSIGAQPAGNLWANVLNGSVVIKGSMATPWPGLYYGFVGSGYPYNSTNSQGKLSGAITDYAPLTRNFTSMPVVVQQPTFEDVNPHGFNVTAAASDVVGFADITGIVLYSTKGTCAYLSNASAGDICNVTYECNATSSGNSSVVFNFTNTAGLSASTNNVSHAYPDRLPALSPVPFITPSFPTNSSILTCNPGTFADPDGDLENNASRAWAWYRNGTVIAGQTTPQLNLSLLSPGMGENFACWENTSALYWPASTASAFSLNVTVGRYTVAIAQGLPNVTLACFQAYMNNTQPDGQDAHTGIFTFTNLVNYTLYNLTMGVDQGLPAGLTLYAQTANYVNPSSQIYNATNTSSKVVVQRLTALQSKMVWIIGNCANVTDNQSIPFSFVFGGG